MSMLRQLLLKKTAGRTACEHRTESPQNAIDKLAMLVASIMSLWMKIGQIGTWLASTGTYLGRVMIAAIRSLCGTSWRGHG